MRNLFMQLNDTTEERGFSLTLERNNASTSEVAEQPQDDPDD